MSCVRLHFGYVVWDSHDIDLSSRYCHKMVMLKDGYLYTEGSPQEVITASNIEAVYGCAVTVDENPATGSPRVSLL